FDDLQNIGIEAFTKKHDPYWDILLNENLPQPVINLPKPAEATDPVGALPGIVMAPAPRQTTTPVPTKDAQQGFADILATTLKPKLSWEAVAATDRHMLFLVRVIARHDGKPQALTLGSVKAEKLAHVVESHLG